MTHRFDGFGKLGGYVNATFEKIQVGVIGVGNMGRLHAQELAKGGIPRAELSAVCDVSAEACAAFAGVPAFSDSSSLVSSGLVDAIIVATPHYDHTPISVEALGRGLHVLC